MSDFRCEWQALHGPRCSHQCNECKDNDTPPEPRMTSERQETEQAFERWYNHAFATRGVDTKHMNDCEDAFEAGRTLALRATPRAGSASKERGFFEWSCGCSLNNGLVTPCATHASPAAAPREHPSPEPYCASCDAREGEPCPHNVIQCARPRRAHPPRAVPDETRDTAEQIAERMYSADRKRAIARSSDAVGAALTNPQWDALSHDRRAPYVRFARLAWEVGIPESLIARWRGQVADLNARLAAHPPRAGEVTVTEGMVDAGVETLASGLRGPATNRDLVRAIITAAIGRPS